MIAVSCVRARAIDARAIADFGLSEQALVDAAGRGIAGKLKRFAQSPVALLAGSGNNAADALRAAAALLDEGFWRKEELTVVLRSEKELAVLSAAEAGPESAFALNLRSVARRGVQILVWDGPRGTAAQAIRQGKLIVDGLAGTGLSGAPRGGTSEIIAFINELRRSGAELLVASIDVPSGLSDSAEDRETIVHADATIAVEPIKSCLYRPFARPLAGRIIPIEGIFPEQLLQDGRDPEIADFTSASKAIPTVGGDVYKHRRGVVDIYAGSVGATGAAKLASRGAAASGAGLIRIMADDEIWPVLAASETGAMVRRLSQGRIDTPPADAALIGPGWGTGSDRKTLLGSLVSAGPGVLVLDADAVRIVAEAPLSAPFARPTVFTPHPLEFALLAGCGKRELEIDPDPILLRTAAERNAVIILKGHVMRVAAPDGRLAYIDGMEPVLATGGSGDVLAGIAAGIAARMFRSASERNEGFDPFPSAVAAAALLVEAGRRARAEAGFCAPEEFARHAGKIAGDAWMRSL